ncbi:MAG: YbhN family protein [Caldilineaceae bacterium]|nr:YbhN family protein [Caldilineaceae bacterium]HRJ40903.1 lysylphosphatidylglycerol synthase transmembrane domain-containing protein [Caldilineaceae bacterium]
MTSDLRRKFLWSLLLAFLVYIGLILYADWQALRAVLSDFPWRWLPAILGLTLLNYGGRLIKWHWYLGLVGVRISFWESARIFGIGFLMVLTPGKVGEFFKSVMVRNLTGAPVAQTAPVVLAERMTDGLAMLLLAGVGLFAFADATARLAAAAALLGIVGVIVVVQIRPLALWLLRIGEGLPVVRRFAHSLAQLYESSYTLFRPANLLIAVGIGVVSWLGEGLAYFLVVRGMGAEATIGAALIAIFIFSISSIIGAVVATPGGLGGTEGSLVALSEQLLGLARTPASAGALLVRFATLWFGVALGIVSFALWPHLLTGSEGKTAPKSILGKVDDGMVG